MSVRLLTGDCRETLPTLEPSSVQACITSPPYYGLRDYGLPPLVWGGDAECAHEWAETTRSFDDWASGPARMNDPDKNRSPRADGLIVKRTSTTGFCPCGAWRGSLGLEPTPDLFVGHMVEVFRHVKRVLRDDGVLWLNLGDSYFGGGYGNHRINGEAWKSAAGLDRRKSRQQDLIRDNPGYKPKDLMMMPFRVAMALQADGWYLRSVIPWLKRNSMPESVTDRPATAVEYVFLLAKSSRYFWDADAVRVGFMQSTANDPRQLSDTYEAVRIRNRGGRTDGFTSGSGLLPSANNGRNWRNADAFFQSWQGLMLDDADDPLSLIVNPAPFTGSHFATFPPKLVEPMIKASTSEKGQCPECGAPWVRDVAITGKTARAKLAERGPSAYAAAQPRNQQGLDFAGGHDSNQGRQRTTTGWRASCTHAEAQPVPQTILDPFFGAGTVGLVADRLGRSAIGCELKPDYADMGSQRIINDAPLFMELENA